MEPQNGRAVTQADQGPFDRLAGVLRLVAALMNDNAVAYGEVAKDLQRLFSEQRGRMVELEGQLAELRVRVGAFEDRAVMSVPLLDRLDGMQLQTNALRGEIIELERRAVVDRRWDLAIEGRLAELEVRIGDTAECLDQVGKHTQNGFATLDRIVGSNNMSANSRFVSLERQNRELEHTSKELRGQIEMQAGEIARQADRIDRLLEVIGGLEHTIGELVGRVNE